MPKAIAKGGTEAWTKIVQDPTRVIERETNDCTVVALAAVCDVDYKRAHDLLAQRGRRRGRGFRMSLVNEAARELGFKVTEVDRCAFIARYPGPHNALRSVTSHHPDRFKRVWADGCNYMLVSNSHVLACKNGEVIDWSRGRTLRIRWIYKVERVAPTPAPIAF